MKTETRRTPLHTLPLNDGAYVVTDPYEIFGVYVVNRDGRVREDVIGSLNRWKDEYTVEIKLVNNDVDLMKLDVVVITGCELAVVDAAGTAQLQLDHDGNDVS